MCAAHVKRSSRSQNWLADYIAKANNGGIARVLLYFEINPAVPFRRSMIYRAPT